MREDVLENLENYNISQVEKTIRNQTFSHIRINCDHYIFHQNSMIYQCYIINIVLSLNDIIFMSLKVIQKNIYLNN